MMYLGLTISESAARLTVIRRGAELTRIRARFASLGPGRKESWYVHSEFGYTPHPVARQSGEEQGRSSTNG
jgi:hypothetical protein